MPRLGSFSVRAPKGGSTEHMNRFKKPHYLIEIDENFTGNYYKEFYTNEQFLEIAEEKYKEKIKQKMQQKSKDNLLQEVVISLKKNHTENDVYELFDELKNIYGGHTILRVAVHRDEGHFVKDGVFYYPSKNIIFNQKDGNWYTPVDIFADPDTLKKEDFTKRVDINEFEKVYNYHAHVVFSMFDMDKGRVARMQKKDMQSRLKYVAEKLELGHRQRTIPAQKKSVNSYKNDLQIVRKVIAEYEKKLKLKDDEINILKTENNEKFVADELQEKFIEWRMHVRKYGTLELYTGGLHNYPALGQVTIICEGNLLKIKGNDKIVFSADEAENYWKKLFEKSLVNQLNYQTKNIDIYNTTDKKIKDLETKLEETETIKNNWVNLSKSNNAEHKKIENDLKTQITEKDRKIELLTQDLATLATLDDLKKENLQLKEQLKANGAVRTDYAQLEQLVKELKVQITNKDLTVVDLQKEINEYKNNSVLLQKAEQNNIVLSKNLENAQQENANKARKIELLSEKLQQQMQDNQKLSQNSQEMEKLQKELDEKKIELEKLRNEVINLSKTNERYKSNIHTLEKEKNVLEKSLDSKDDEIDKLNGENINLSKLNIDLNIKYANLVTQKSNQTNNEPNENNSILQTKKNNNFNF